MEIKQAVVSKLNAYGIKIYSDYKLEDEDVHVYITEKMILYVDLNENFIDVAFQATTRPEVAARLLLIVGELPYELSIMESFIFDEDGTCIEGEKAYDLIESSKSYTYYKQFERQMEYTDILLDDENCYDC